jgi:hypothetical protein
LKDVKLTPEQALERPIESLRQCLCIPSPTNASRNERVPNDGVGPSAESWQDATMLVYLLGDVVDPSPSIR